MCRVLIIYNFACPVTFTSTGRSGFQALTIVVVAAAAKLELVGFHYCEMVASWKRRRRCAAAGAVAARTMSKTVYGDGDDGDDDAIMDTVLDGAVVSLVGVLYRTKRLKCPL